MVHLFIESSEKVLWLTCVAEQNMHMSSLIISDILSQNTYHGRYYGRCFLTQHIISDFLFKICIMVDIGYSLKKYMANI